LSAPRIRGKPAEWPSEDGPCGAAEVVRTASISRLFSGSVGHYFCGTAPTSRDNRLGGLAIGHRELDEAVAMVPRDVIELLFVRVTGVTSFGEQLCDGHRLAGWRIKAIDVYRPRASRSLRVASQRRTGAPQYGGQRDRLPLSDHPTLSGDRKVRECALAAWPVDGRATP
jgi:hypothetical protein